MSSVLASLVRMRAVAHSTRADLGRGGVLVVLVSALGLAWFAGLGSDATLSEEDGRQARFVRASHAWFAWLALGAAVCAALAVSRMRRASQWRTTPLRVVECAAGTWWGGVGPVVLLGLLVAPLYLWILPDGLRSEHGLRPYGRQLADEVAVVRDGEVRVDASGGPVLLDAPGARASAAFTTWPARDQQVLRISLDDVNYAKRPDTGYLTVGVKDGSGTLLVEREFERLPVVDATLSFPTPEVGPIYVLIKPGSFKAAVLFQPAGIRVDPTRLELLSAPGGRGAAIASFAAWSGVWAFFGGTLGWCAAAWLADALAVAVAALGLVLLASRDFLLDIARFVSVPGPGDTPFIRASAEWAAAGLRLIPTADAPPVRAIARGEPFSAWWPELPWLRVAAACAACAWVAWWGLRVRRGT